MDVILLRLFKAEILLFNKAKKVRDWSKFTLK